MAGASRFVVAVGVADMMSPPTVDSHALARETRRQQAAFARRPS
jgi:hypothetical protein